MSSLWQVIRRSVLAMPVLLSSALALPSVAYSASALSITAPANGTHVAPGQSVVITVSATGTFPQGVFVIGHTPIGVVGQLTGSGSLTLNVPTGLTPGSYTVTAFGVDSSGAQVSATPVSLSVERTDLPTSIQVTPRNVSLDFIGDSAYFRVISTFSDGSQQDVTSSSSITFSQSKSGIVQISGGRIIGTAAGTTLVTVTYAGAAQATVLATVASNKRGDLNSDGVIDSNDVAILHAALNTPATTTNDARDLNRDGVINSSDEQVLVSLCTHPNCATH